MVSCSWILDDSSTIKLNFLFWDLLEKTIKSRLSAFNQDLTGKYNKLTFP